MHSPRELVVCAAVSRERLDDWDWLKWLPHTRAAASPLETHLAADPIAARALLEELSKLLEERRSRQAQSAARSRQLPVVLLLLDEGIAPERALIGPILAEGAEHGIAVLWLGSDVRALPGECRAVVELDGEGTLKLTNTQRGEIVENVIADELTLDLAEDAAVALAPVVDDSATEGRGRLPRPYRWSSSWGSTTSPRRRSPPAGARMTVAGRPSSAQRPKLRSRSTSFATARTR